MKKPTNSAQFQVAKGGLSEEKELPDAKTAGVMVHLHSPRPTQGAQGEDRDGHKVGTERA